MNKKKQVILASLLLTIILLITACAAPVSTQQFTIRLGIIDSTDLLPYYVMLDQGFDKKYGLQVVEIPYQGGTDVINALASGTLDGAPTIGTPPILLAAESGIVPSKVIGVAANSFANADHPAAAVFVAANISGWKELEGKTIGVNSKTSVVAAGLIGRLKLEGISSYKLIEIPFANMGLAVASGDISAAAMNEPYISQSILRNDGRVLGWTIGDKPFISMEYTMVLFSTSFQQDNPEAVKAYLSAYLEACQWISKNSAKSRTILAKRLSLTIDVAEKMYLLEWSLDGHNDTVLLDDTQKVLVDIGFLKATIPSGQLFDETLLNQVLKGK
jgi:ABC-type nitrate/sulfonate/bicarbonate transport system substrate-binding protein